MKESKNKQILESAQVEFAEKGLGGASMESIAQRAEVSKRTLYKYYPTKDELYDALVDVLLDQVQHMYELEYDPSTSMREQLEKLVNKKIELTLSDSFLGISRIALGEMLRFRPPTAAQMEKLNKSEELFLSWLKAAKADGQITSDIELEIMASQFHSILKGEIFWPVLMGWEERENIDPSQARDQTVDFFMRNFCS